ncbi:hypothetical protein [Roseobacter sinensis]|uniref:Uncharacterized protein n=1 Tax=Roseobacter sinensis TaxID=2931391 RepID=A0ABT3BCN0_9RHOB|nr:hypothetical protein [Roseobacter sp. WL0113]MCV3270893.1 hypothetical protein [Roseobacter sp. WL0113]
MLHRVLAPAILLLAATAAAATQFQSGDWAAAKMGNRCFVYTERAAPDTSGTLIFSFDVKGFNAAFQYEYTPWPGETDAPWDEEDAVVLEVDGSALWLGDEMFTGYGAGGYVAEMTAGFVPEMLLNTMSAAQSVTVALDRVLLGETWVYGVFSISGFREALARAAEWCSFDPRNLPRS